MSQRKVIKQYLSANCQKLNNTAYPITSSPVSVSAICVTEICVSQGLLNHLRTQLRFQLHFTSYDQHNLELSCVLLISVRWSLQDFTTVV